MVALSRDQTLGQDGCQLNRTAEDLTGIGALGRSEMAGKGVPPRDKIQSVSVGHRNLPGLASKNGKFAGLKPMVMAFLPFRPESIRARSARRRGALCTCAGTHS